MKKDALLSLRKMQRPSSDGHEITICPLYRSSADWSYVALLYPLNPHDTTPSVVLEDYKGSTWDEIAEHVPALLSAHPSTGFYFL